MTCNISSANATLLCLGGSCDVETFLCDCETGFYGAFCELSLVDLVPSQWLAHRSIGAILLYSLAVISLVNIAVYWVKKKSKFPQISTQQLALVAVMLSGTLSAVSLSVDPYRFNLVKAGIPLSSVAAYSGGLTVLSNGGLAFVAVAYGVLLAHWVTVRQAKAGAQGWSNAALFIFWALVILNVALAVIVAFVEAFIWVSADMVFFAYLALFALSVCTFIIITAVQVVRQLTKFRNDRSQHRLRRIAQQVILVCCAMVMAVVILIVVTVIPFDTPSPFVWVRNFLPIIIQCVCLSCILFIFRYQSQKAESGKTMSTVGSRDSKSAVGKESPQTSSSSATPPPQEYVIEL